MGATIKEVARLSQTSMGTVSRFEYLCHPNHRGDQELAGYRRKEENMRRLDRLEHLLEWLESNLDLKRVHQIEAQLMQTLNYEKVAHLPKGATCSQESAFGPTYPYAEAFVDPEKMLYNELINVEVALRMDASNAYCIRSNHGTGIFASLFGCRWRLIENNMPWTDHLEGGAKTIRKLIEKGIPNFAQGLLPQVREFQAYFRQRLSAYPQCAKAIHLYHPDLQGIFDNAHLIWGPEIFYALYDEPDLVHALLQLVTDTYIEVMRLLKTEIDDSPAPGFIYHWGTIFPGAVVLRNDAAINLSAAMYAEFVQPYDEQVFAALGEGSIHFCGSGKQWLELLASTKGLRGINFGNPEMHDLEQLARLLAPRRIAICGWRIEAQDYSEWQTSCASYWPTGITLM